MSSAPSGPTPSPTSSEGGPRRPSVRQVVQVVFLVVVLVAVAVAVWRDRQAFAATVRSVGWKGVSLSALLALAGVACSGPAWRTVLAGLGVRFGLRDALSVLWVSQLGKYLPGSVWPFLLQMEAGRRRGASRRTVLSGNLLTMLLSMATGLVLAAVLLPLAYPEALRRFWWALAALPLVVVLVLPRTMPTLVDRLLVLLRREPLGVTMAPSATLVGSLWSVAGWVGQGLHLAVLVAAVSHFSWGLVALCIGGMGLAVSAGILFIPAPAGAGMREVVLGFVLVAVIPSSQAVAVIVASRVIIVLVDVLLAGIGALLGRVGPAPSDPSVLSTTSA